MCVKIAKPRAVCLSMTIQARILKSPKDKLIPRAHWSKSIKSRKRLIILVIEIPRKSFPANLNLATIQRAMMTQACSR
jgi:3-polyprenyl-4-hydroxybenzoate decarboxylase